MINDIKKDLLREYSLKRNDKLSQAKENSKKILSEHLELKRIEREISITACDHMLSTLDADDLTNQSKIDELLREKNLYLKNNKIPTNYAEPEYDCNICNDTAYDNGNYCICFKQKLAKKLFYMEENMHLPDINLENYSTDFFVDEHQKKEMNNILTYTKNYMNLLLHNEDKNLIFFGSNGLGKTYLLSALANSLIENGKIIVYQSAPAMLEKIKRASFIEGSQEIIELIKDCDLLIIDDLGKEHITDYTKSTLFNIINIRYNSNKPIAISTNLDLSELEQSYDSAIQSRLLENSTVLFFDGSNLRIK